MNLTSANNMHGRMIERITRSPVLFFDSNPAGRIMTRLSKDMSMLDLMLPPYLTFTVAGVSRSISVFVTLCVLQPWLTLVIVFSGSLMYCYYNYAANTLVQAQRVDSVYRGPLNSGMQNLIVGMISIRAYERVEYFRRRFIHLVEKTCNATFTFYTVSRAMSFYLDIIVTITAICVSASVIFIYRGKADSAQLAFSMQIITDVVAFFSVSLRFIAECANYFTGSQRIHRYCVLESEDELVKETDYALMGRE